MTPLPFSLVSQAIGLGGATGTRAGMSLLAVALAARAGKVLLPPELLWMTSTAAMVGFVVVLAFEYFTYRDDDMQMMLGVVHYGLTGGSGATVMIALLDMSTQDTPTWMLGSIGAAIGMGSLALRRWLHAQFEEVENALLRPRTWLTMLEEGGTVGLCAAVFLAPSLALAIVVGAALAGLAAGFMAKQVEARFRRPCPACAAPIRQEASRCPHCRADVPVVTTLDLKLAGKAQATLHHAVTSVASTAERLKRRDAV